MPNITCRDRLKYRFDNFMSKGTGALILALFLFTAAIIVLASVVVLIFHLAGEDQSLITIIWGNFMRVIDAGTVAGDEGSWAFLLVMLAVTVGGIFIFSTLIGVLTTGLEAKIDQLRKGRSFVAETGHTVILGWSPQVFTVVSELILANASQKRGCIAILADRDKMEMEDELRAKIENFGNTTVVCRSGNPIDLDDLDIVNPSAARSIIVLPKEGPEADASVLKAVLALAGRYGDAETMPHLTAVIRDADNLQAAKLAGGNHTVFLPAVEIIARIMAQTSRHSGLSVVVSEIVEFSGDEIYIHQDSRLTGMAFGDVAQAYEKCAAMGIKKSDGEIVLNPDPAMVVGQGDSLVCLAEDDDKIDLSSGTPSINDTAISIGKGSPPEPERMLVLGWNKLGRSLVKNLDGYMAPGSSVLIASDVPPDAEKLAAPLENLAIACTEAEVTDRRFLDKEVVAGVDYIVILSRPDLDPNLADADTLTTLLHLRDIADTQGLQFAIITEILDSRTRDLAQATRADDFIVSDRLLSLMLAQVSETPALAQVFGDLLSPRGAELYLKPISYYVKEVGQMNFHTLVAAAGQRKETAIGYRISKDAADPAKAYGVHINPAKSQTIDLAPEDLLIVLAEDDG